jgi:hypothetical protein
MTERIFSDLGAKAPRNVTTTAKSEFDPFGAGESLLRQDEQLKEYAKILQSRMSPPGTFKIPPLLELRRQQHLIPDGAFKRTPVWDWCFVYQIARDDISDGQTYGDTKIVMSANTRDYKKRESPRGVLVAAGLQALDTLSSHGIQVGDVVTMIRNAPWAIEVDFVGSQSLYVYCLRDADLVSGEDLQKRLNDGVLRLERVVEEKDGQKFTRHRYVQEDGTPMDPMSPWIPDDL